MNERREGVSASEASGGSSRADRGDGVHDEFEIPIDPVVTADHRRVMRLPYSLHAKVSRVVQPIDDPGFDFRTEATPDFLEGA